MPSPVKAAALELGLPVSHSVDDVLAVGADLGVVVAFGQLIKPHVLDVVADGQPALLATAALARRGTGSSEPCWPATPRPACA
jgi:hypothetical protein